MSWIDKILPHKIRMETTASSNKSDIPEGVWIQCPECQAALYQPELEANLQVCPKCNYHLRISARVRLKLFLDENSMQEIGANIKPIDSLKFKDTKPYEERLTQAQKKTGEDDAMVVMRGTLEGSPLVASAFEFGFLGGSMGSVVGERFVQGAEFAIEHRLPYVCFTASGGARMQESLISLMQMAKVSAVLAKMKTNRLPYIVVLTDPTTGGVSASLAMLGDLHLAEPKALVGFAGPRVIEQTVREKLPEGFQRSEFLLQKGIVDMIVHRKDLRATIHRVLEKFKS